MSSESPEGTPQPVQQVPPFPQPPSFSASPAAPYAGIPAAPPQPLRLNGGLPIAALILSALYIVICVVEIFVLNNRISIANRILNDPASVTVDQAQSADNNVSSISLVALLVFLAAFIVLAVWQRSLRKTLVPIGQYDAVMKQSGYQAFRITWLVSIALSIFLRASGTFNTPQDVISHDHKYMFYFGLRAVLGGVLVYLALRLKHNSERVVTLALTGYPPAAVSFLGS